MALKFDPKTALVPHVVYRSRRHCGPNCPQALGRACTLSGSEPRGFDAQENAYCVTELCDAATKAATEAATTTTPATTVGWQPSSRWRG